MHAIMWERGGFGRNNKDFPFYELFKTPDERDAARASYGPRCLNCGDERHFAGECPKRSLNHSELINPAVGDGTADEAEKKWRRWQQRLCQRAQIRHENNRRNT